MIEREDDRSSHQKFKHYSRAKRRNWRLWLGRSVRCEASLFGLNRRRNNGVAIKEPGKAPDWSSWMKRSLHQYDPTIRPGSEEEALR